MSEHLLDTQHAEHLVEYLRFLRRKRDQCVSEIAAEFKELLQSRLLEDQRTPMLHTRRHGPRSAPGPPEGCSQRQLTLPPQAGPITRAPAGRVGAGWPYSAWFGHRYTREDVEALINGLLAVVRTTVKKDLQFTSSSSILLLKQVLEQVEKAGLTVNADLSATEDLNLLAGVQAWEQTVQGSGVAPQLKLRAGVPKLQGLLTKALPTLGPPVSDPKVIEELQAQKLANEELTVKFQKLQVQCLILSLTLSLSLTLTLTCPCPCP